MGFIMGIVFANEVPLTGESGIPSLVMIGL